MNWGHPERGKVLLLAGDLITAAAAAMISITVDLQNRAGLAHCAGEIVVFMLIFSTCFYVFDLYDVRALNGARTITRLLAAAIAGGCIFSLFLFLFQWTAFSRVSMSVAIPIFLAGSFIWRRFYRKHQTVFRRRSVLLIGTVEDALRLRDVTESNYSQYFLLGVLRVHGKATAAAVGASSRTFASAMYSSIEARSHQGVGTAVLEPSEEVGAATEISNSRKQSIRDLGVATAAILEELVLNQAVDTIIVRPDSATPELAEVLTRMRFRGIRISTIPDLCGQILEKLPLDTLSGAWFSFATGFNLLHVRIFRRVKRLTDILLACAGLLITLPISLVLAIAIKLESPGPILFKQWRVGWREKPFRMLKFRSMRQDAEAGGESKWAAVRDPRATRVGKTIRRLHIDEIPQMMNVLMGQMSFIGPRPEIPMFVEQLKAQVPFYHLRHYLPPGITGWAQVNYPYGDCIEDSKKKLEYDLFYVRHASPTLDLRILLRTARVVLFRSGSR